MQVGTSYTFTRTPKRCYRSRGAPKALLVNPPRRFERQGPIRRRPGCCKPQPPRGEAPPPTPTFTLTGRRGQGASPVLPV